jgi:hypothetical protein
MPANISPQSSQEFQNPLYGLSDQFLRKSISKKTAIVSLSIIDGGSATTAVLVMTATVALPYAVALVAIVVGSVGLLVLLGVVVSPYVWQTRAQAFKIVSDDKPALMPAVIEFLGSFSEINTEFQLLEVLYEALALHANRLLTKEDLDRISIKLEELSCQDELQDDAFQFSDSPQPSKEMIRAMVTAVVSATSSFYLLSQSNTNQEWGEYMGIIKNELQKIAILPQQGFPILALSDYSERIESQVEKLCKIKAHVDGTVRFLEEKNIQGGILLDQERIELVEKISQNVEHVNRACEAFPEFYQEERTRLIQMLIG